MRLLRVGDVGAERPAVLVDTNVAIDVGDEFAEFDQHFFAGDGIARLRNAMATDTDRFPRIALEGKRLGAPIAKPYHVLCVGLNYADHAAESGMDIPSEPVLFNKAPNTVIGPDDDLLLPPDSQRSDWEVELAVVIGKKARYLASVDDAMDHIAGFAISNDVSERAYQLEHGGQWVKGKSAETFNPLGPWLVTPDEIDDVQSLAMRLTLNDEVVQDGTTSTMVFSVAYIVWYVSQFMVLDPGDLINTGTPPGVGMGMRPPRYLSDGDVMELTVDGLGTQRQKVRRAQR